ncbi:SIS domain-containing protein [archaeon]|jgi:D-sedoheptulose 7-phosphate isomerase|nr:SIS domain-containing protein [archaeon]MBT4241725.1 SIS domain-containing protein [archaeon]MBT4418273.1 SIS domain-containing protein [archaeon]
MDYENEKDVFERYSFEGDFDELHRYYRELMALLDELNLNQVRRILNVLRFALENKKNVYIIGNGGSASTAEHYENDLMKIGGLRAFSLTNTSVLTALGNDNGYENIFVDKLKTMMDEGDVVIGISGSGNSMNVVKALEYARENGGIPIGVLGFNGGKCLEVLKDYPYVLVKSEDYGYIEDVHLTLSHSLSRLVRKKKI